MDRLQTMSVFVAVADEAGFAAASRRLNMSPPSVTRAVSNLEERLGARLLHRTTRSLQLTDAGTRYLDDCRRILSDIEEADEHASGTHAAPRGLVSVTASVPFGGMVLAPVLNSLLDRYPDISLSVMLVDRIVHLMDEGIDVAVRIAELPDSTLSAIRVGQVRRALCASPEYLAKNGRPKTLEDLRDHELIDFTNMAQGGEWLFSKGGKVEHFKPKARLHVNKADVAISAAIAGRGLTRVLSYMTLEHIKAGALEFVLEDCEQPAIPVHIVHKETGRTTARVRAVVDHLVEHLRKSPALHH